MNNQQVEKQAKKLFAHMKDYQQATQLKTKGEAAIFNKHRQADGKFSDGLNEELNAYRKTFAEEWGIDGWRNTQFVKQQIEEIQLPTQQQNEKVDEFREQLAANAEKRNQPRPRLG